MTTARGRLVPPVSRKQKTELLKLLNERNPAGLRDWAKKTKKAASLLTGLLHEPDELVRWRAIETIGLVAAMHAEAEPEAVRDILQRLLWMMNDDSGNFSPHAPEAIGEILVNVPSHIDEFGNILASFLKKEPFERSAHRAIARVAAVKPGDFSDYAKDLATSLSSSDPAIRGSALAALAAADRAAAETAAEKLKNDSQMFSRYNFDTGEVERTTVGELACGILE